MEPIKINNITLEEIYKNNNILYGMILATSIYTKTQQKVILENIMETKPLLITSSEDTTSFGFSPIHSDDDWIVLKEIIIEHY